MAQWNPWHGCTKISEGCRNCYVYRIDSRHGRDSREVCRTGDFDLPLRRRRDGRYKIASGETVYTCFSSDFLLDAADEWRPEAWKMIRRRSDLHFFIITKRIDRLAQVAPADWGDGYPNVTLCCTVENQDRADYRLPLYLAAPVRRKIIVCEPLLGALNLAPYLAYPAIMQVIAGGESGPHARPCRYEWVLDLRRQCVEAGVPFVFKQTGACFVKEGRTYAVPRSEQHAQARKAGIDYLPVRADDEMPYRTGSTLPILPDTLFPADTLPGTPSRKK